MAFTPPALKTVNTLITAADWNTFIRDNFAAGVPGLFAAKGDLAVGSGPQAAQRLAVGGSGQALQVDPAFPLGVGWDFFHRAKVRRSAQASVPSASAVYITFDTEVYDNGNLATPGSQVVTVQRDGVYRIAAFARLNRNGQTLHAGESIYAGLTLNGNLWAYLAYIQPAAETYSHTPYWMLQGVLISHALAGWAIGLMVYQNSGGTMLVDANQAWLEIEAA